MSFLGLFGSSSGCDGHHFEKTPLGNYSIRFLALDRATIKREYGFECQHDGCDVSKTEWEVEMDKVPIKVAFEELIEQGGYEVVIGEDAIRREKLIDDEVFRVLLDLIMCSDPWPLEEDDEDVLMDAVEARSRLRGYNDFSEAYHEFEPSDDSEPYERVVPDVGDDDE